MIRIVVIAAVLTGCAPTRDPSRPFTEVIAVGAFNCPYTLVLGLPGDLTARDLQAYQKAFEACFRANPATPCVATFTLTANGSYSHACTFENP